MKKFIFFLLIFLNSCSLFSSDDEKTISDAEAIPEEEIIAKAERAYQNGMVKLSRQHWNELKEYYPTSYFIPLAEIKLADSFFLAEEFSDALTNYENFLKLYPDHEAAPYALFQIGNTYVKQYRKSSLDQQPLRSAITSFERLIEQYPNSLYITEAKTLIQGCNEGLANHELLVAKFYAKQQDYRSAANRIRYLKSKYPNSKAARHALKEIAVNYPEDIAGVKKALAE